MTDSSQHKQNMANYTALPDAKAFESITFICESIHLHNAVVTPTRWQQVSFSWWWKEEGCWPKSQGSAVYNFDEAQERDRPRHVGWHAAAQAVLNQPPDNNMDRLHLPRFPRYSVKITLLHLSFSIAVRFNAKVPDFPHAGCPYISNFANAQLASYKAHTTLYLKKPSWHFELSRLYHLCSQVKCNE